MKTVDQLRTETRAAIARLQRPGESDVDPSQAATEALQAMDQRLTKLEEDCRVRLDPRYSEWAR